MKSLHLSASDVPRYYRVKVYDSGWNAYYNQVHAMLESELQAFIEKVRSGLPENDILEVYPA